MPVTSHEIAKKAGAVRKAASGVLLLLVLAVGLLLFIRPTTVSTGPDQVALHYSDGAFTPRRFKDCVESSTRAWGRARRQALRVSLLAAQLRLRRAG